MKNALTNLFSALMMPFRRKDRFSRGVVAIISGTAISRLIAFLTIPILARIFTPDDFGVLAMFTMLIGVLGGGASWRYEAAIVLPDADEDGANLLAVTLLVTTVSSILLYFVLSANAMAIAKFVHMPDLESWLPVAPAAIWAFGCFSGLRLWKSRLGDFPAVSVARVADTMSLSTTQVALGFAWAGNLSGLLLGPVVGRFIGFLTILLSTWRADGARIFPAIRLQRMKKLAIRYRNFPLFDNLASLMSIVSRELPILLLGVFFFPSTVGLYSVANRIMSVPLNLLATAIAQVYLPVARDAAAVGRLGELTLAVFQRLMRISLIPMLLVAICSEYLIWLVLGINWKLAATFLQLVAPWLLFCFIASPISELFAILERQREKLILYTLMFISRAGSLIIGGIQEDAWLAVGLYGLSGAILWAFQCVWLVYISGVRLRVIFQRILVEVLWAAPFAAAALAAVNIGGGPRRITAVFVVLMLIFCVLRWDQIFGAARPLKLKDNGSSATTSR